MAAPLADRLRPKTLDDMVGQRHLLAPGKVLRKIIESRGDPKSGILWSVWRGENHPGNHDCPPEQSETV